MISWIKDEDRRTVVFLGLSLAAVLASLFWADRFPVDPAWVAIVLCGIPIIKGAVAGLVTEFDVKADVLVAMALIASVIIGEIFAAGEVAFIMALGAYLEDRTVAKARAGIEKLVRLTPAEARLVEADEERMIPADQVKKGDILRVLAGETIAVDGRIIKGRSSINQAVMTGDPLPVDKEEQDEVFSGTVNQFGTFDMRAEKVGEDSSLQRMIRLVESADAGKAKIVGLADRWATWIVVIALVAAAGTWMLTGEVIRAVTILVVFCPCALVLATPTAIMAGIGNATKYGILIREGDALERLAKVKTVAFDKTGTLTYGTPSVVKAVSCENQLSQDALLALAAAAEKRSEHPLGKAVVSHFSSRYQKMPAGPAEFCMIPGRGVYARIDDTDIYAGNLELLKDHQISVPEQIRAETAGELDHGSTIIYLADSQHILGYLVLSDTIRPDMKQIISSLHSTGTQTVLLTGDSEQAAGYIASQAGITQLQHSCLPEDKLTAVQKWQNSGQYICMVGDGINDAPALKAAQVGIAMGGIGSDIAIDAADIALISDDIKELPHLIRLSRKTMRTIRINLTLSMALNFAAITLAMTGILTPVIGALVHNAGSVAVIIHSSLLLKWRKQK